MSQGCQEAGSAIPPKSVTVQTVVIPVIAEELVVDKLQHDTGGVRVTKKVQEHVEIVDEPLLREEVTVERCPMNVLIDAPARVREEGDTLIIPVMEEFMVVERQLLLKEEVHIHKRRQQVHAPQQVVVRSEEVRVEPLRPAGPSGDQKGGVQ